MANYKRISEKEAKIQESLLKKEINIPVYYYEETGSTMDAAAEQLDLNPEKSAVFISDIQKAGRGRQSRQWQSIPGNLFITFSFEVSRDIGKLSGFSLVAGLAAANTLSNMGYRVRLKWPNDILTLSSKKIGGILTEIKEIKGKNYILCGIGINLISNPDNLPDTTSLKEINGVEHSTISAASKLIPAMKSYFEKFISTGFAPLKNEWMQIAAFVGRDISVHVSKDKKVTGMLLTVTAEGALQIENKGKIETITAGDIELMPAVQ